MEFKDILLNLLAAHDMKPADLCRETGIPTSLMSNYLKGTKSPGSSNSIKIASVFGISLDELAGRQKEKALSKAEGLTDDEIDLILKLRRKREDGQKVIRDLVDNLLDK